MGVNALNGTSLSSISAVDGITRSTLSAINGQALNVGPAPGYSHVRAITIDHTKCGSSNSTDWPFWFTGTFAYLKTTGNGGDATNASGFDIIFTSDQAGLIQLAHEIETYNASTGAVNFHIKIPMLSSSVDTVIYMHYGNAAISTSQENKTGVWSNNFALVTHLKDGTTPNESDSSANNHTSSNPGNTTAVAGQCDGGVQVNNGANSNILSYAEISDSLSPTAAVTMSMWFRRQGTGTNQIMVNKGDGATNPGSSYEFAWNTSNQLRFEINDGSAWKTATYSTAITDTASYHFAFGTFDGTNVKIYVDGTLRTTTAFTGSINNSTTAIKYGSANNGTLRYNGYLDEVRVATVARSADWQTAEWNNQSAPGTFFSVSSEL